MDTKMKGLFKGLRYISQIFDNTKEPEMQIGYPTDVKHVAHIGWDGPTPTLNGPSWINEFESGMEGSPQNSGFSDGNLARDTTQEKPPARPPRHKSSFGDPKSPQHDMPLSGGTRQLQCHHSSSSSSVGSPSQDLIQAGSQHSRKSRSAGGTSSDSQLPDVPKQNRRRKVKGSSGSGGGSIKASRSARSKGAESAPELAGAVEETGSVRPQRLTAREEDSF